MNKNCLWTHSMNESLQTSVFNFSASFTKICKFNILIHQNNNNCLKIINIHTNKFFLINNNTDSAAVMSHSQRQISTKNVDYFTMNVFQTSHDNQFLQTKHIQRDSATSVRSHKHYKWYSFDDYENRHVLNEVTSDDVLKSSFDDQCIKFKIKIIKHNTSDETKHQKSKSNLKSNIKQLYSRSFS